jgi:hypothetical protein
MYKLKNIYLFQLICRKKEKKECEEDNKLECSANTQLHRLQ